MNAPPSLQDLRRRPHWSCSALRTFLDVCSLQYAFRYVLGLPERSVPAALVFGRAFHSAATWFHRGRLAGRAPAVRDAADLFAGLLDTALAAADPPVVLKDGDTPEGLLVQGRAMLRTLLEGTRADPPPTALAEAFSLHLRDGEGARLDKPLIGEFDLVLRQPDGSELIVDWKTAARRWSGAQAHTDLQATCYLAARRAAVDTPLGFRFDIVTKTKVPALQQCATDRLDEDFVRLGETVRVVERMVRAEHFVPNDRGFACADCPYQDPCRDWQRDRRRLFVAARRAAGDGGRVRQGVLP